jgi:septal ring factor EnvC (AmiA/AmiB activator)
MPRSDFPRSSTQRRADAAVRIERIGIELIDMGRCTPCQKSGSLCFVLKGYSKCSSCTKKNIRRCDGNFSVAEFDEVDKKRAALREDVRRKREEVSRLAAAAAKAYSDLAQAQKEENEISSRLEQCSEAQSRMLRQELTALDALSEETGEVSMEAPFPWEIPEDFDWGLGPSADLRA